MNSQKVIDIALGEVGYLEKSKSAYIRNPAVIWYKVDGAGYDNFTKYAYELDREDWYNGPKNGFAWCSVFVDWCFIKAYGLNVAGQMKNHGIYDAGCDWAVESYKNAKQWHTDPKKGDQIFFMDGDGDACHTGLVIDVDDTYIHTVEGNTSSSEFDSAGGGVFRKKYRKDYWRIMGFGRPDYGEEDEDVTVKELMNLLKNASPEERRAIGKELDSCVYEYRVKMDVPGWAVDELQEAKDAGITDATRPMTYSTRLEAAIMCKRAVKK
jgi:hypothetical protein